MPVIHLQSLVPFINLVLFIVAMIAHKQWIHPDGKQQVPASPF